MDSEPTADGSGHVTRRKQAQAQNHVTPSASFRTTKWARTKELLYDVYFKMEQTRSVSCTEGDKEVDIKASGQAW